MLYDELLRIKAFREQNAANAVVRQRRVLEERTQAVQIARDKAAEFRDFRVKKEKQLFEDIKGQAVPLRKIETMKMHVASLREQEADLASRILAAEKAQQEAQKTLANARAQHAETVRAYEKFKQFIAIQRAAERQEQARREENELEEIANAGNRSNPMTE